MSGTQMKTAWITGASSGIGEALAKAFVAGGGACVLSGRNMDELNRVARETGAPERCLTLPFDTTDLQCLPKMRAHDPEKLFDMVEALVASGYAAKMSAS